MHLLADRAGLPLAVSLSAGQAAEMRYVAATLEQVRVPRARGGAPRCKPRALAADRAYSHGAVREYLRARRIEPVIPWRRDQIERDPSAGHYDRCAYRDRNAVERCIGWLKEARRLATRFEKLAVHYLGVIKLAMIRRHLKVALPNEA